MTMGAENDYYRGVLFCLTIMCENDSHQDANKVCSNLGFNKIKEVAESGGDNQDAETLKWLIHIGADEYDH